MLRTLFILFLALLPRLLEAQKLPGRISPVLLSKPPGYFDDSNSRFDFTIDMGSDSLPSGYNWQRRYSAYGIHVVRTSPAELYRLMASATPYRYIDEQLRPLTEGGVRIYDMSANRISTVWQQYVSLRGQSETVSVKENRMDTADIDLLGRYINAGTASPLGETHATVMTTLIAGSGNSSYTGKGVAPQVRYSSSDFLTVLPDLPSYYQQLGIQVQNHSYGTGLQPFYGSNARAFDLSVQQNQGLLHVFSSGNSGTATPGQGIYAGITGFSNITGNMKMAKNLLLVGAMDSLGAVPALSSRGPAYDGRIAPHLVAFAEDGTSGAAALVSGTAVLLQQLHKQLTGGAAAAALIRAVLVNSSRDAGTPGPDYAYGFGQMDAAEAVATVRDNRFFAGSVGSGGSREFTLNVPAGMREMKVTLAWSDPAAASGAAKALSNDLDLELVTPSGELIRPWILSSFPAADSLRAAAWRGRDTLNNTEQVTWTDPAAGVYTLRVRAGAMATTDQAFHLAYGLRSANIFSWEFPLKDDVLESGNRAMLRWRSSFLSGSRGLLERSINNGAWETVNSNVDLQAEQFEYPLADSAYELRFRMTTPLGQALGEQALVAPSQVVRYGYVCDTALLAYWSRQKQSGAYRLYRLDGSNMLPIALLPDTSAVVRGRGGSYLALAPVVRGCEAFRGPATDYSKQGVGCYIDNFLADLLPDNTARLSLKTGTTFNVASVEILKTSDGNRSLYRLDDPAILDHVGRDQTLRQGQNIYQAQVRLKDGTVIKSNAEIVYYLNNRAHIVYPNPVMQGSGLFILSEEVNNQELLIMDQTGRVVVRSKIRDKNQVLNTGRLAKGVYMLRILDASKPVFTTRFLVQ